MLTPHRLLTLIRQQANTRISQLGSQEYSYTLDDLINDVYLDCSHLINQPITDDVHNTITKAITNRSHKQYKQSYCVQSSGINLVENLADTLDDDEYELDLEVCVTKLDKFLAQTHCYQMLETLLPTIKEL